MHYDTTTTNRVEGAHADLKRAIDGTPNLYKAFKHIDMFYRTKVSVVGIDKKENLIDTYCNRTSHGGMKKIKKHLVLMHVFLKR